MFLKDELYSIKMRASRQGVHVSGGERIATGSGIRHVVQELLDRPSDFDFMNIKIQKIQNLKYIEKTLDIRMFSFQDHVQANRFAAELISSHTGIDLQVVQGYIQMVHAGAGEDGNVMRGAMLVDTAGARRESDTNRGVRTTCVDFEDRERVLQKLLPAGFTHRTADALAIATKNLHSNDILAEYCVSDDPSYLFGYVALKGTYIRIFPVKERGNPKGGRIYFIRSDTDIDRLYRYLEEECVIIRDIGEIR